MMLRSDSAGERNGCCCCSWGFEDDGGGSRTKAVRRCSYLDVEVDVEVEE